MMRVKLSIRENCSFVSLAAKARFGMESMQAVSPFHLSSMVKEEGLVGVDVEVEESAK